MAVAAHDLAPAAALEAVRQHTQPVVLAGQQRLPVVAGLDEVLPGRGLQRGTTVAVSGSTTLALALVAGASAAGSWCAVVGLPSLGLVAAAELGVVLERVAVVAAPGPAWPTVVAALLDALDIVVVRAPAGLKAGDARRLSARARERGAVLVPVGDWREAADVRLSLGDTRWHGLEAGWGHLRARQVEVLATGRGAAARPRRVRLWLPAEGGGVRPVVDALAGDHMSAPTRTESVRDGAIIAPGGRDRRPRAG